MVFRKELTYHEVAEILDTKNLDAKSTGYTFLPGIYEVFDNNPMLKHLLPDNVKIKISVDDIKLKSNLTTNKTSRFTRRSFSYTILVFTQYHSGPSSDIDGFVQVIPGK